MAAISNQHVERLQLVATTPIGRRRAPMWLRAVTASVVIMLLSLAALQLVHG